MKIDTWVCQLELGKKCTRANPVHGRNGGCHGEGFVIKCDMPGCKEEHGNDRYSWRVAYAQGWYHKKNIDYCPMDIPPRLVAERRAAQEACRS